MNPEKQEADAPPPYPYDNQGYNPPAYNQPAYNQPAYGQQAYGQQAYGQLTVGPQASGWPAYEQATIISAQPSTQQIVVVQRDVSAKPSSYMWLSCIVFWFCNCLFGLIAFGYSSQSSSAAESGQMNLARSYSKTALWISVAGLVLGLTTASEGRVCDEWVDALWDMIMLGEPNRPATYQDLHRFFTLMDWDGDERVSLSEFEGIFLPCTEMTADDINELFDTFASKPVKTDIDPLDFGSGLHGVEDDPFAYYDFLLQEAQSLVKCIGDKEIRKIWNFLHTDLSYFLKSLTGIDTITRKEFKEAWRTKILPLLTRKGCPSNQGLFHRISMGRGRRICSLMSKSVYRHRFG